MLKNNKKIFPGMGLLVGIGNTDTRIRRSATASPVSDAKFASSLPFFLDNPKAVTTCDRCHTDYKVSEMMEGHDGLCPSCVSLIKEGVACPPPLVLLSSTSTPSECLKACAEAGVHSGQSEKQSNISDKPEPVEIQIRKRVAHWHSSIKDTGCWGTGHTAEEAIGDLVRTHSTRFNIVVKILNEK